MCVLDKWLQGCRVAGTSELIWTFFLPLTCHLSSKSSTGSTSALSCNTSRPFLLGNFRSFPQRFCRITKLEISFSVHGQLCSKNSEQLRLRDCRGQKTQILISLNGFYHFNSKQPAGLNRPGKSTLSRTSVLLDAATVAPLSVMVATLQVQNCLQGCGQDC